MQFYIQSTEDIKKLFLFLTTKKKKCQHLHFNINYFKWFIIENSSKNKWTWITVEGSVPAQMTECYVTDLWMMIMVQMRGWDEHDLEKTCSHN